MPAPAATPPPPPGLAESGTSFLDFDALEQMESKEVAEPKVEKIPETSMASGPVAGPSPGASIVNNKDRMANGGQVAGRVGKSRRVLELKPALLIGVCFKLPN